MDFVTVLSEQFHLKNWQVEKVIELIDEGNTIPFIARYRKEAHGSLDDQTLREIAERLEYLRGLEKRRQEVASLITAAGSMTEEIAAALDGASTLSEIEDIYRPFRPKRKTRASVARQKGLEPLAQRNLRAGPNGFLPHRPGGSLRQPRIGRGDAGGRARGRKGHHRGVDFGRRRDPQAFARGDDGAGRAGQQGRQAGGGIRL